MPAVVVALLALLLAGCGGGEADVESECERLVRQAAEVDAMQDTVEDLDPAIEACGTLSELEAASDTHPAAFDGVSVREYVANRCLFEPALASTAICEELAQ